MTTTEKHEKARLIAAVNNFRDNIESGILTAPPKHRIFKEGDRVNYGAHKEVYVRKVHSDGMFYTIESMNVKRGREAPVTNEIHIIEWHGILPTKHKATTLRKEESYRINTYNSDLDGLISKVHSAGVEFDSPYQRGHVWTKSDKVALIDSIFNNINIGLFVFVQRAFSVTSPKLYEVLDGKQRLTTLVEFFEDRFKYKGFYYSELSPRDKNKFNSHSVSFGYLVNPNKKAIFDAFIKLNTCGKPMANKHINHVKDLLHDIEEKEEESTENS